MSDFSFHVRNVTTIRMAVGSKGLYVSVYNGDQECLVLASGDSPTLEFEDDAGRLNEIDVGGLEHVASLLASRVAKAGSV